MKQPRLTQSISEEILNHLDDHVYVSDVETYETLFLSAAYIEALGLDPEGYKGKHCYALLHGQPGPCPFCKNALLSEDAFMEWEQYNATLNRHYARKDRKILWNGRMCRFGMARDITELKQQEDQHRKSLGIALQAAQQAGKARAQFLSSVSHELRTPLNAILGFINVATASEDQPALVNEALKKAEGSARYLLAMLNDILDVAHMESGTFVLDPTPFEFADFLGEVCSLFVLESRQRHVAFRPTVEFFPVETLFADSTRLKQLLICLLSNAFKFTDPGGEVRLEARPLRSGHEQLWVEFVVSDTGKGMDEAFMQRMFEPFESVERAHGPAGAGLGLPICKKILDLMEGELDVQSAPGQGTQCRVRVPVGVRRSRRDALKPEELQSIQQMRLLVVDDAEGSANMKRILDSLGITAHMAGSGGHAVDFLNDAALQGQPYDACIVHGKVMDLEFAGFWEKVGAHMGVRRERCALSMLSYAEACQCMQEHEISHFLGKPYFATPVLNLLCTLRGIPLPQPPGESLSYDFSGKRLLLVEDNELNRIVAFELLSKVCKFSIESAANGQEAVEMFRQRPEGYYDLILMDICMPVMDGHTAAMNIRASLENGGAHIPIVALSANSLEEDMQKSQHCGISAHVAKPLDLNALCPVLARAMA